MKIKPLHIPKEKLQFGLKVACRAKGCETWIHDTCPLTGLALDQCKFGYMHSFKSVVYEPNTNIRRTKIYKETDLKKVLPQAAIFYNQVKNGKHSEITKEKSTAVSPPPTPLLTESLALYIAFLKGAENIPEHKRRARSNGYCDYVERTFLEFLSCQNEPDRMHTLKVDEVDEGMIGKFHKHLSRYSPVTYNMKVGSMRTFYNHLIKSGRVKINPFYGVLKKPETHDIKVLRKEEFTALIDAYNNPALGKRQVGKETKDFYRPWVVPAIKMALMTGRRREEIINMKWNDIAIDSNGVPLSICITDFKVSRLQNRLEDNPKKIDVPITAELKQLFAELGYENSKDSDQYIIGNDDPMDRKTMKIFLSKSFSHFWSKTEYAKTKNATLKVLRKTYLSSLSAAIGMSNARVISQHSDTKVLSDHYVSAQVIGATAKNFSVFPKSEERQVELNKLRNSNNNEISIEK